jgi:SARP family transcriptional regulator, regulator of embCAB operon
VLIQILGPLVVDVDGQDITPSAQHLKRVFTILALSANQYVSVNTLVRELWGDGDRPPSALTTVQTYILNLRKLIANAMGITARDLAKSILLTQRHGYSLHVGTDDLDLARFGGLAREGSRALSLGDTRRAAEALDKALSLWRGAPLSDVRAGEVLSVHIRELEISWLAAVEQRVSADLLLGRHYEVLGELSTLVNDHPFNETLHAQYLLALHRTGRRTDALAVYRRLRDTLAEQMGLEPSTAVQDIHRAILSAEDPRREWQNLGDRLRAIGTPVPAAA